MFKNQCIFRLSLEGLMLLLQVSICSGFNLIETINEWLSLKTLIWFPSQFENLRKNQFSMSNSEETNEEKKLLITTEDLIWQSSLRFKNKRQAKKNLIFCAFVSKETKMCLQLRKSQWWALKLKQIWLKSWTKYHSNSEKRRNFHYAMKLETFIFVSTNRN